MSSVSAKPGDELSGILTFSGRSVFPSRATPRWIFCMTPPPRLALAFSSCAGEAVWDGIWRLTAVSVPEKHRAIRDTVRRRLTALRAAAISTGLYVSPHNLREEIPQNARPWLTTATTSDLNFRDINDPIAITEALWPVSPIVSPYQAVNVALKKRISDPTMPGTVRRLYLAQAYEGWPTSNKRA